MESAENGGGALDVVSVTADLLFVAKIGEVAKALGLRYKNVRTAGKFAETLAPESRVVILDLTHEREVFGVLEQLRDAPRGGLRVVGFFPHVSPETAARAHSYGFVRVMARSKFVGDLEQILRGEGG